jgi:hypothetical protein
MGRYDWTLLTTSVSPLVSSDMYLATGQVQEYSVQKGISITEIKGFTNLLYA